MTKLKLYGFIGLLGFGIIAGVLAYIMKQKADYAELMTDYEEQRNELVNAKSAIQSLQTSNAQYQLLITSKNAAISGHLNRIRKLSGERDEFKNQLDLFQSTGSKEVQDYLSTTVPDAIFNGLLMDDEDGNSLH